MHSTCEENCHTKEREGGSNTCVQTAAVFSSDKWVSFTVLRLGPCLSYTG